MQVVAVGSTPRKLQWPAVAFSPSGKQLGCIAFDHVLVWDLTQGELQRDFATPGLNIHGDMDFPQDGFILANNQFLIGTDNELKLWQYNGAELAQSAAGMTFFVVGSHNAPGVLVAATVPQKSALKLLDQALNQPNLFVFREGATVQLDVSKVPGAEQANVRAALTNSLSKMNVTVAGNADVQVVAGVEGPKEREISYIRSGDYKVEEYTSQVKFMYQGKQIWQAQATNIPFVLSLNKGENVGDKLREMSAKPNYGFFSSVVLPKFLQRPGEGPAGRTGQTLGVSNVTAAGIQ